MDGIIKITSNGGYINTWPPYTVKATMGTDPNLRLDLLVNGALVVPSNTLVTLQLVLFHGH